VVPPAVDAAVDGESSSTCNNNNDKPIVKEQEPGSSSADKQQAKKWNKPWTKMMTGESHVENHVTVVALSCNLHTNMKECIRLTVKGPKKIFIGGLHPHLVDEQVMELLQAFGSYHSSLSSYAGAAYCFVEYVNPTVTLIAMQGFHGMGISGSKTLMARLASSMKMNAALKETMMDLETGSNSNHSLEGVLQVNTDKEMSHSGDKK